MRCGNETPVHTVLHFLKPKFRWRGWRPTTIYYNTPGMSSPTPTTDGTVVDYRIIGLSPQYWSYTPLLIGDLVGLPLINGLDCFVAPDDGVERIGDWKILPISRVLLRGVVTAIDRRPNGCTLIVLDDGTGAIDCRYWDDSHRSSSAFSLPSLLPEHDKINKDRGFRFIVGDSLEVMGKIKALTAGATNDKCELLNHSVNPLEVRFGCVREVHASSVCLIDEGETRIAKPWNGEMVHWLKCMKFSRNLASQCSAAAIDDTKNVCSTIRNGKDVLPLLGEDVTSSVLGDGSSDFTNFDKTLGNNNVLQRKCCGTPHRFREALFYCHCEATLEALDTRFCFRDALLNRLLDMEAQLQRTSDSCYPSATENCMDLFGVQCVDTVPPPLLFTFETIYKDEELTSIANEVASSSNTTQPEANGQRLLRKTFAAMKNDGLLSLYDLEEDLYILVSRTRVIEPFLRRARDTMDHGGFLIPQPFFLASVPKKRITDISNWISSL